MALLSSPPPDLTSGTAHVSYTVNIQIPLFRGVLGTIYLEYCRPLGHPGV
jgi:hypothetical protein